MASGSWPASDAVPNLACLFGTESANISGMTANFEPASVRAGDTITWLKVLDAYPATALWELSYTWINSAHKISIASVASGSDFLVTISALASAAFEPGTYVCIGAVTNGLERHTVIQSNVIVLPNLAGAATYDSRSSAKKALESVNLLLETYGNKAYMHSYEISGRRQPFQTPGDFLAFRSKLMQEVAAEQNAALIKDGLAPKNLVAVRFNMR